MVVSYRMWKINYHLKAYRLAAIYKTSSRYCTLLYFCIKQAILRHFSCKLCNFTSGSFTRLAIWHTLLTVTCVKTQKNHCHVFTAAIRKQNTRYYHIASHTVFRETMTFRENIAKAANFSLLALYHWLGSSFSLCKRMSCANRGRIPSKLLKEGADRECGGAEGKGRILFTAELGSLHTGRQSIITR